MIRPTSALKETLVAAMCAASIAVIGGSCVHVQSPLGSDSTTEEQPDSQGSSTPSVVVAAPLSAQADAVEIARTHSLPKVSPIPMDGIDNVFRLGDRILSGSEPQGDKALDQLAAMGVKTILTVDGKAPEWEAAAERGMRYVHLPIQYNGMEDDQLLHIAKTFRELDGPFYVHCFHGKHRGPAAAAVGRIVLDGTPREQALAEMLQWCGTSPHYTGLFDEIAFAGMPSESETTASTFDFPAALQFDGIRAAMVPMTRHWDQIKFAMRRNWKADPKQPDINLSQEATKLSQVFESCESMQDFQHAIPKSTEVMGWLSTGTTNADRLSKLLELQLPLDPAMEPMEHSTIDWQDQANDAYRAIAQSCRACHNEYRD